MKIRYNDESGFLEIDLNEKGSNFIPLVKCSAEVASEIIYNSECRTASELYEFVECILDEHIPTL